MRLVAGRVAAMAKLLLARALCRSSIGKTLAASREPSGTIGKMLHVGEAAEKPEGRV